MSELTETLLRRLPGPTVVLLHLGTAFCSVLVGVPKDQFGQALGTGAALSAKDKLELDSGGWWARRLAGALGTATVEDVPRTVVVVLLVGIAVALVWRRDKVATWISLGTRRFAAMRVLLALMAISAAFSVWSVSILRGPLIIEGLAEGLMAPQAFHESGQQSPTRSEALAANIYSRLHGIAPDKPLERRSVHKTPNYCTCPTSSDFDYVTSTVRIPIWLTLLGTLFLLNLSQCPTLVGTAFLDPYTGEERVSKTLTIALCVPVALHSVLWYFAAQNLGVLEAVVVLRDEVTCDSEHDPFKENSWPFCKPKIEVEATAPERFLVRNVWPVADAGGPHAEILVKLDGVDEPVHRSLKVDQMVFKQGEGRKLELTFGPADLHRLLQSNSERPTDILVFDGQSTAELSLQ